MKTTLSIFLLLCAQLLMAQNDELLPSYKYDVKKVLITDDISLAYVDEGDKKAPVLLMVHGLGGYIKNWYPTIDGLKDSYRCIAVDLPGYGLSTLKAFEKDDYMEFFADAVNHFVKALKLKKVTLLGHSMGGQVSTIVALKQPKWLDRLILAAPAGFETFTEAEAKILKQYAGAQALMSHNEQQIRAAYQVNFVEMPPLAEEMIQDRLNAKKASWFEAYAKVREGGVYGMLDHPVNQDLEKIKIPTYVIFGSNDQLIPNKFLHPGLTTEQVANIGKKIPRVDITMIENAGHMLQMDNPEGFNQAIKQVFIKN